MLSGDNRVTIIKFNREVIGVHASMIPQKGDGDIAGVHPVPTCCGQGHPGKNARVPGIHYFSLPPFHLNPIYPGLHFFFHFIG